MLYTKEYFIVCTVKNQFLKAIQFLSFKIVQTIHKRIHFQVFFTPTKDPLQLMNSSLTILGKTYLKLKRAKTTSHKSLTTDIIGWIVSSSRPQRPPIWAVATPSHIQSQDSSPCCLPSIENHFKWDTRQPKILNR